MDPNPAWAGDLAKTVRECTCDEMLQAIPLAGLVGISPESSWLKPVAQRVVFHYAPSLPLVYGLPPTSSHGIILTAGTFSNSSGSASSVI